MLGLQNKSTGQLSFLTTFMQFSGVIGTLELNLSFDFMVCISVSYFPVLGILVVRLASWYHSQLPDDIFISCFDAVRLFTSIQENAPSSSILF